ncbi:4-(cytidine 5'-diphospho)-2-C-methyl-D-erythritol kinase [Amnibacterium sp. CER49]|uniref:4-(cytidine 5'-diphospho)-2-C-methyl-D-erythritol kinase n=1 Tax=Amnibacterium sp. CER49 TaxID=3039161 RepID=UPI0024476D44|nr:4-(cytidine 5'-diphospho)-2-C-methyl-D-erythritol kinase [Amnibacterium sp. CER49]MDH2445491.1 4-(cytidine 5'-diphospho)-2-C-methyl-D-erythritol kinase [Amnibacterium sp. CER49]
MTTSPAPVHARAPGKVNVFMRVGRVLPDGYHDVATAYQAVALFEELHAEPDDDLALTFSGPIPVAGLPVDGRNIVIRAAHLLQARTGYRGGARMQVVKRVPIAGGMGGGSADAAAALVALDALWDLGLGRDGLAVLAAELGADVPFALLGGTAIGTNRGEKLSPALAAGTLQWVIALADRGLSTPEVYGTLDALRAESGEQPDEAPVVPPEVLAALRSGDPAVLAPVLHNDLEAAALHLRPELGEVLELGRRNGALTGIVSGSGPSIAFLAEDLDAALSLQIALSAARLTVLRATGPAQGARVVEPATPR